MSRPVRPRPGPRKTNFEKLSGTWQFRGVRGYINYGIIIPLIFATITFKAVRRMFFLGGGGGQDYLQYWRAKRKRTIWCTLWVDFLN